VTADAGRQARRGRRRPDSRESGGAPPGCGVARRRGVLTARLHILRRLVPSLLRKLPRRAWFAAAPAMLLGALLLAPTAAADVFTPQSEGGSPNADEIRTLYNLIGVMALIVFVAVEGLLIYCLVKYRARKGTVAAQIHGNTRLEIGWTVGAALILVFITVVTFIKLDDIKNPPVSRNAPDGTPVAAVDGESGGVLFASTDQPAPPKPETALNIKVDGQQYVWRFQYPGPRRVFAYETMVVPTGTTVTLDISADDVMHSWWIPALGGKMDAVPGYVNKTWFQANEPGTYTGQCAELCGRNHANMYAQVNAVPPEEYQRWYDEQADAIEEAQQLGAEQREQIESAQGEDATGGGGGAGGATDDQGSGGTAGD
jgi:cytochrome c oxidase subunit 2